MNPDMQYVQSSSIEMVGYDADVQQLHVMFKKTGTYVYGEVPPHMWDQLMAAPSKGVFVNAAIKPHYAVVGRY